MTSLEPIRQALEELDAIELSIVDELCGPKHKSHRGRLAQEHRVASALVEGQKRAKFALETPILQRTEKRTVQELQANITQIKQDEMTGAQGIGDSDPFAAGRAALLATAHPRVFQLEPLRIDSTKAQRKERRKLIDELVLEGQGFLGEEYYGKYMDLHAQHELFQNLGDQYVTVSYLDFLQTLGSTGLVPLQVNRNKEREYMAFLRSVLDYMDTFQKRAYPLQRYFQGTISSDDNTTLPLETEVKHAQTANELETCDAQELKKALSVRGLPCGGTVRQRAERLFASKNQLVFAPPVLTRAEMETRIKKLAMGDLAAVIESTRTYIVRRLTMTFEEIAKDAQQEEEEAGGATSSDEDEGDHHAGDDNAAINDKSGVAALLGASGIVDPATGKVIPKWMYRLHGLHLEFKCEICGNNVYYGKRNFERHFREARHTAGMKALNIPNTLHFNGVTRIDDAKALYARLKMEGADQTQFEEEVEDAEGNIVSRRALLDLQRQGL